MRRGPRQLGVLRQQASVARPASAVTTAEVAPGVAPSARPAGHAGPPAPSTHWSTSHAAPRRAARPADPPSAPILADCPDVSYLVSDTTIDRFEEVLCTATSTACTGRPSTPCRHSI